jgi:hypothetical protein
MFSRVAGCALSLALAFPVLAQDAPVLSTVPADDVAALMAGRETGLAQLAEHHLWPSPLTVLEHQVELNLAPDQVRTARQIETEMEAEGREIGRAWLAIEVELEEAFRSGRASKGKVATMVMRSGELRAQLRALQLAAHIQMRPHLTVEQLDIYSRLPARAATGG